MPPGEKLDRGNCRPREHPIQTANLSQGGDFCLGTVSSCRLADIRGCPMSNVLGILWTSEEAQDIAEYAVMLAVILVLVIGTVRLIGGNANNAFSSVASNLQ
jgi:Flp pilus assembly pilin Flp